MVTSRILHSCSLCDKPFVETDPEWFMNGTGIWCHACEDGMIGQRIDNDEEDPDE